MDVHPGTARCVKSLIQSVHKPIPALNMKTRNPSTEIIRSGTTEKEVTASSASPNILRSGYFETPGHPLGAGAVHDGRLEPDPGDPQR